jgi:hypothetical protein
MTMVCSVKEPHFVALHVHDKTGLISVSGNTASKLPDFTALSKQLALATPSSTSEAAYTVSHTVAQACPATGAAWSASSNLPPIANSYLCSCMVSSLSCVATAGLSGNETATLFSIICGLDSSACDGFSANATTGIYGPYSMCDAYSQLSFAMNQYYQNHQKAPAACDFNGNAKIQSESISSSCSSLLSQVSTRTGIDSSRGSPVSSANTRNSAAGVIVPRSGVGLLRFSAYLLTAVLAGAIMMLL